MTAIIKGRLEELNKKTAKVSFKDQTLKSIKGTITKKKGKFYIKPEGAEEKKHLELESVLQVQEI